MLTRLSILIPTFNTVCVPLVRTLVAQADAVDGLEYEVIVADDGSTDAKTIAENDAINEIPHCRYVKNAVNVGRSAIRNALGKEAGYEWLLFLDSDVEIPSPRFISNYLVAFEPQTRCDGGLDGSQRRLNRNPFKPPSAVNGGLVATSNGDEADSKGNLRYRYERSCEARHSAAERSRHPYRSFRSTNFMISKEAFERCPFDESVATYGYEDVLLGKSLCDKGLALLHIDNPVAYTEYEDNAAFLAKTEEAMRTLGSLSGVLDGYSGLLRLYRRISRLRLTWLVRRLFETRKAAWRSNLLSRNPSLFLFKLYKLGYFTTVAGRS